MIYEKNYFGFERRSRVTGTQLVDLISVHKRVVNQSNNQKYRSYFPVFFVFNLKVICSLKESWSPLTNDIEAAFHNRSLQFSFYRLLFWKIDVLCFTVLNNQLELLIIAAVLFQYLYGNNAALSMAPKAVRTEHYRNVFWDPQCFLSSIQKQYENHCIFGIQVPSTFS